MSETYGYDPNQDHFTSAAHLDNKTGDDAEKEYRAELARKFATESVGTVGLYTTMDLEFDEKAQLDATFAARNPGRQREDFGRGGWGNYGEISMDQRSDYFLKTEIVAVGNGENLSFLKHDDGTYDILYSFNSKNMIDDTRRPGRAINVGFSLDGQSAAELKAAIVRDPSFIHTVVDSQLGALGFSDDRVSQLRPKYDNWLADAPEGSVIEVTTFDGTKAGSTLRPVEQTTLSLDRHQSLLPKEVVQAQSSGEITLPSAETASLAMSAEASVNEYVTSLQEAGIEPAEIAEELADNAMQFEALTTQDGTDAEQAAASMEATVNAYNKEIEREVLWAEDPEAHATELAGAVIEKYVMAAQAAGLDRAEIVSPYDYMGTEPGLARSSFELAMLKDAFSELTIDLTAADIARMTAAAQSKVY